MFGLARTVGISAIALLVAGCTANDAGIFRTIGLAEGGPETIILDAKQRGIITVERDRTTREYNAALGRTIPVTRTEVIVCAEPSPDALSAIATSLAISANVGLVGQGSAGAGLGSSLSEAATQLGRRNATIQLLRDAYYRLCEASANGTLNSLDYALLANKLSTSMVMLLAIEEIVGQGGESVSVTTGGDTSVSVETSVSIEATPGEEEAEEQEETPGIGSEGEAETEAGAPSVGTVVSTAPVQHIPPHVARTIEFITDRFTRVALTQECLVFLNKVTIDMYEIVENGQFAERTSAEIDADLAAFEARAPLLEYCDGVLEFAQDLENVPPLAVPPQALLEVYNLEDPDD